MDVSVRTDASITSQSRSAGNDGRNHIQILQPPPFKPNAIKMAALDHISQYQDLYSDLQLRLTDSEGHAIIPEGVPQHGGGDERMRFFIIRGMLLTDLNRLLRPILDLEERLKALRTQNWLIHSVIAVGSQVLISSSRLRRMLYSDLHLWVPGVAQFVAYPVAAYYITKYERQISNTKSLREGLEDLIALVQRSEKIYTANFEFLTDRSWEMVPWEKLNNLDGNQTYS